MTECQARKKKKKKSCLVSHPIFFLSRSFSLLLFQTCVIACCLQAAVNTQKHWLTRLWRMGKGTCFFFSFPNDYTRACLFCYVRSNAVGTLHVWWRGQLYISGLQVTPWIWDVACMTWWWELSWALWKGTRCNYIHCRCMPMTLLFFSSLFQLHELEKEKKRNLNFLPLWTQACLHLVTKWSLIRAWSFPSQNPKHFLNIH